MLIVIPSILLRSFFYRDLLLAA